MPQIPEEEPDANTTNASNAGPVFDFDSILGAANTVADDFIGPLSALADFLDNASSTHPYIAVVVGPFKVLVSLEVTRRTNNQKIDALYNRMGAMMAALQPLMGIDQKNINMEKLLPLLRKISEDLSKCGNVLDFYKKQALIVRFIKSTLWQSKLIDFTNQFIEHQKDIGLCLSVANFLALSRVEDAINQIHDILRRESKVEGDVNQFIEAQGGLEKCVEDEKLFAELVRKSGDVDDPVEATRHGHYYQTYPSGVKYLPISSRFVYHYQVRERGAPPTRLPISGQPIIQAVRSPSPQIRYSRRRPHPVTRSRSPSPPRLPTYGRPITMQPTPMAPLPPLRSPSPQIRYSRRRPHPVTRSRSPSPAREPEIYPMAQSVHSDVDYEQDGSRELAITALKLQVKSALETSLDVAIERNTTIWMVKFTNQTRVIQSSIESTRDEIIKAIEDGKSRHHKRLDDPMMQEIWETEKWRSSVSVATLLEGVHDYFWRFFHDRIASGDHSQPIWTLQFMEKPYWSALTEVLDIDQSGLVSVTEVNRFTDTKPEDMSLAVYLATSALRCRYEASYYPTSLVRLMEDIGHRSLPLWASPEGNVRMESSYTRNLQVVRSSLLAGIMDPPRHMSDALKHNKLHDCLTRQRLIHETYWGDCLKKVHWEVDSPDILDAFAHGRPIEQYLLTLIFVLLNRHLVLVKACTTQALDPLELPSSWENISKVMNIVNSRVSYLEGCFSQSNDQRGTIRNFACGMFSEWERFTVVDKIQERLEERPFNEEISLDDIRDFLRYPTTGLIPLTRSLPITRVSTNGELLPAHLLPIYVRAIRDYAGADDKDLSFHAGDIIVVSKTSNDGWWTGSLMDKEKPENRVFPSNLVVSITY